MEHSAQTIMMLVFLGIATWAAISAVVIMFAQPASNYKAAKAYDWAQPAAFAAGAVVFGLMATLAIPASVII